MSDDSPSGVTETKTNNAPWSGQQPSLEFGFGEARNQYDTPQEFFPNSTVVPFAPQTESALQGTEARAVGGAPGIDAAEGQNLATSRGDYLSSGNPYFSAMMDRVENQVRPRIDSQFASGNRSGGAGSTESMQRALADAGAALEFQNYGNERGLQQQAAQQAPGLYQAGFAPQGALQEVGRTREGLAGANLQEDIARHDFAQQEPRDRLRQFMATIGGGSYGGSSTQAQPYFAQNPWAQGLGGAAALASIYGNLSG